MLAEVQVVVELDADNHIEALVAAHDAVLVAQPGSALVIKLISENAVNIALEQMSCSPPAAPALPLGPLALGTKFKIEFFPGKDCKGQPSAEYKASTFENARVSAESVLSGGFFGSSRVIDQMDTTVLQVQAPRGGFEVECLGADSESVAIFSWCEAFADAKVVAANCLVRPDVSSVRISDLTDRIRGPVLLRVIR